MEIQCECGKFRAELKKFPKDIPGRLRCYCDDCQSYLHFLNRTDLLDGNGGTEVIPVYPSDIEILQGKEHLKCVRLSENGTYRFFASCCQTPVANTDPTRAWAGIYRRMYTTKDSQRLDQVFGKIRASINGKFAHGTLPPGVPQTYNLKAFASVMPFILKGKFGNRHKPSPFFNGDSAVAVPYVLTEEERKNSLKAAGQPAS